MAERSYLLNLAQVSHTQIIIRKQGIWEYGQGRGKQSTWGYYGEPGTNGTVVGERAKGTLVLTHGNPANMPMYNAVKELELRLGEIVKEVFR